MSKRFLELLALQTKGARHQIYMSFTHEQLARLRPFLYHLTARENLPRIRRERELESASRLALRAARADLLDTRRREHVPLFVDGEMVLLRDQAALHEGNMRLGAGWTFGQFVRHLNDRVFFWPGTGDGPIDYGVRHFERYEGEAPVILRVSFAELLRANPSATPLFCRYNSGSPRWSGGVAASRGGYTFVPASGASFRASDVVEVTVPDAVALPEDVMSAAHPRGPWQSL